MTVTLPHGALFMVDDFKSSLFPTQYGMEKASPCLWSPCDSWQMITSPSFLIHSPHVRVCDISLCQFLAKL